MKLSRGFTLMELLIVLAIIVIIAAITIPSLTAVKIHGNETSAAASLRAIQTAQTSYQTTYTDHGYATSLPALGGPEDCKPSPDAACLIDEGLASGSKAGYVFAVTGGDLANGVNSTYVAGAAPAAYNHTGIRRFCTTEKNVLRADPNTEGSTSPPTAQECAHFAVIR